MGGRQSQTTRLALPENNTFVTYQIALIVTFNTRQEHPIFLTVVLLSAYRTTLVNK